MKQFAMAASDPAVIAAGADFVNKAAAPHELAARQAMDIKDHMFKMSVGQRPSSSGTAVPGTLLLPNAVGAAPVFGAPPADGASRTLADFMGIKSAAYAEPPVSLAVVLSDLETYKAA